MNPEAWIDPRIKQVRPEQVRSYLLARGWQLQPYPGPELLVFGGLVDDDGQPVIQVLPSSTKMRSYMMRLEELITALSIMEDRPAIDVLTDVLRYPLDPPSTVGPIAGAPVAPASK